MTPSTAQATEKTSLQVWLDQHEQLTTQKTFTDLESFESVKLAKVAPFVPVKDAEEIKARVGNDTNMLLEVLNRGLYALEQAKVRADETIPWNVVDSEGKISKDVYTGTPVDASILNPAVLNMAKLAFGYLDAKTAEERQASKQAAITAIKSSPAIMDSIKKQAAAALKADTAE